MDVYGGAGTVFEIANGSNTVTTLASFNVTNGEYPQAGLVLNGQGNLYGTTSKGGASGDGTVFQISSASAPPIFTADTPPAATVDSPYSYQFQASSIQPITFSATGLPAWAQLDPSTGILSGTPSRSRNLSIYSLTRQHVESRPMQRQT